MQTAISVTDIVGALELASDEVASFLNVATGEVRTIPREDLSLAEDDSSGELPEWQREFVADAREVSASPAWIPLPGSRDIDEWSIMDDFARSVAASDRRADLLRCLRGAGAFRRFKDRVRELDLDDAWFTYKHRALERVARSWLADRGLAAAPVEASRTQSLAVELTTVRFTPDAESLQRRYASVDAALASIVLPDDEECFVHAELTEQGVSWSEFLLWCAGSRALVRILEHREHEAREMESSASAPDVVFRDDDGAAFTIPFAETVARPTACAAFKLWLADRNFPAVLRWT